VKLPLELAAAFDDELRHVRAATQSVILTQAASRNLRAQGTVLPDCLNAPPQHDASPVMPP
jgi:hypothetical protein